MLPEKPKEISDQITVKFKQNNLIFFLNKQTNTATLFKNENIEGDIIIPQSIEYETTKYNIESLYKRSFYSSKICSIRFQPDSKLRTILKESFLNSSIESIFIPPSVIAIREYAFRFCKNIKKIEIPHDSRLQIIEKGAFSCSTIESIFIPQDVTKICNRTFFRCEKLKTIEFSENSKLQKIEADSFLCSNIEKLVIPPSVTELENGWCNGTYNLKHVIVMPNNKNYKNYDDKLIVGKSDVQKEEYDVLVFACRDAKTVTIPSNIKRIESYAFFGCKQLQCFEVPKNSELQSLGRNVFLQSSIESFSIPPSFSDFEIGWCRGTPKLTNIIINSNKFKCLDGKVIIGKSDTNSDEFDVIVFAHRDLTSFTVPSYIRKIESYAFSKSLIEKVIISPHLVEICDYAFAFCSKLTCVEIPENSELQIIGEYTFHSTKINSIFISPHITHIGRGAFIFCNHLQRVNIPHNSQLKMIDFDTFQFTQIERIFIPSHVTEICEEALYECHNLKKVEIAQNSQLKNIQLSAFKFAPITSFFIPRHLTTFNDAFYSCENLQIIEIEENHDIQSFNRKMFGCIQNILVMIPVRLLGNKI